MRMSSSTRSLSLKTCASFCSGGMARRIWSARWRFGRGFLASGESVAGESVFDVNGTGLAIASLKSVFLRTLAIVQQTGTHVKGGPAGAWLASIEFISDSVESVLTDGDSADIIE